MMEFHLILTKNPAKNMKLNPYVIAKYQTEQPERENGLI